VINELTAEANYDSAQATLLHFLEKKDLDNNEIFYGNYLSAYVLRTSGNINEAIKLLFKSQKYLSNEKPNKFESLLYGNIAECYFSLQQYDEAKKFALQSINASPQSSLRSGGHTTNYSMVGFACYMEKNYQRSLEYYDEALKESAAHGQYCELPLLYTKVAKALQAQGKHREALAHINRAYNLSDSCGIDEYKLNSRRSMYDIYFETGDYKKALDELLAINDLVAKIEGGSKEKLLSELQIQYDNKLAERESETLKELETNTSKLASREKQLLVVTVSSIILFGILILLLIRSKMRRQSIEEELHKVKTEHEKIKESVDAMRD
jgi:tetratricopeptide (TPR) repeat protein